MHYLARESGDKRAGKIVKMVKDPIFLKYLDDVIKDVKIEGTYRKPDWRDMFVVQLVTSPFWITEWATKYHRRYISTVVSNFYCNK